MTLSSFRNRLKIFIVIFLLSVYGISSYTLGRFSVVGQLSRDLVQGISKKNEIRKPIDTPQPYSDTQSASVIGSSVKLCSNTVYNFEVVYPKDWFTTYNSDNEKCTYFASYSFIIPRNTDQEFVPVRIIPITLEDWNGITKFYENPNDLQNITSVQTLSIGEKLVKRVEATTTGTAFLPRGFVKVSYLIFDNTHPLVVSYQQLDEKEDVKSYVGTLDDMAKSLKTF